MRRMLVFLVCLVAALALATCTLPDPKTQAELNELTARVKVLGDKVTEAAEYVDGVKKEILVVMEKGKAGQLTAAEVTELLSVLHTRLNEGEKHLAETKDAYVATQDKVKELSEAGVPWWQIAIWLALGAFNVATGKGYLKEKDNGKIADLAISGIGSLVGALEKVYVKKYHNEEVREALKAVKIKVSNIHNPIIEAEVSKLPTPTIIEPPPEEEPPAEEPPAD